MALAAAPFGAPGLCSDWGIISLTTHSQHRTYSIEESRARSCTLNAPSGLAGAASNPRPQLRPTGR